MSTEDYKRIADLHQAAFLLSSHGISDDVITRLLFNDVGEESYKPLFIVTDGVNLGRFFGWNDDKWTAPPWLQDATLIGIAADKPTINSCWRGGRENLWMHCVQRLPWDCELDPTEVQIPF